MVATKRRNNSQANTEQSIGKLPPQAVDLEEAVLGALMLERDALFTVGEILRPEIFYRDSHQRIFRAIQSLADKGSPVDLLTVTAQLRQAGDLELIGGPFYVTELTNRVASAANIEYHSRIILQKYIQRELIRISAETIGLAYEDTTDVFDLISAQDMQRDKLLQGLISRKELTNSELSTACVNQLQAEAFNDSQITGIPSGFSELDAITAGWQNTDLVILAARPGMGKTSLALQAGCNAAINHGFRTAIFSLEMSANQLMHKQISIKTSVPLWKFKKNKLDREDWSQIEYYLPELQAAPIFWDDTPALNITEFRAKCRRLKRKFDIQLIIIDYLQLVQVSEARIIQNRDQQVGFVSGQLKAVAKELNVPVIALSQLSRDAEKNTSNRRPMLSHLRESGSIEQDADMVIFLYRDEYYGIEQDRNGNSTKGIAELTIAKHRNGPTGDIILSFDNETTAFKDALPF